MDPIPQMVIETPSAHRNELVVTLANAPVLRAAIDRAERGLLAAQAAMDAVEATIYCGSIAPESGRECDRPDGHDGPHRSGMVVWGPGVTEPASASVKCLDKYDHLGNTDYCQRDKSHAGQHEGHMGRRWNAVTPRTAELVPLDESLPWAVSPKEQCGWEGPDGEHCLLTLHGPKVMHAAPIGAGSMRRWPALRSVTA